MRATILAIACLSVFLSCAAPSIRSNVSHPQDLPTRTEPLAPNVPEQRVVSIPFETPAPKPTSSAGPPPQ
jgi:hypothetical protein